MNCIPGHLYIEEIVSKLSIKDLINLRDVESTIYSSIIFRIILGKLFGDDDDDLSDSVLVKVLRKTILIKNIDDLQLVSLSEGDKADIDDMSSSVKEFIGSVYGIVVLAWLRSFNQGFGMWNPATNTYKFTDRCITNYPIYPSYGDSSISYITCDPENEYFGCGFCAPSKHLKVVCIRSFSCRLLDSDFLVPSGGVGEENVEEYLRHIRVQIEYIVEVYSLITDSWRRVVVDPQLLLQFPILSNFYPQVGYTNNTFSWLVVSSYRERDHSDVTVKLLTFHMVTEVFQVTSLPDAILGGIYDYSYHARDLQGRIPFQLSNGTIALVIPNRGQSSFDIWLLLEYGVMDSWTRLCTIGPFPEVGRVLGLLKNGKVFMETTSGELVLADLVTNKIIQNLHIEGYPNYLQITPHKEISFVLKDRLL